MRGIQFIIYGSEGLGKTSLGLQFPKPLRIISLQETGYEDLSDAGLVPNGCENVNIVTFNDLIKEVRESSDVKTLVIDSLSGFAQLTHQDILKNIYATYDNPEQAFGSFSEGWRVHGPTWAAKLENACTVLRNKGVNIILIGHAKIERGKNIISNDYQTAVLDLESWPRAVLMKAAQAVLYLTMDFKLRVTKKWKNTPTESKVVDGLEDEVDRIIYCSKHPSHSAKNRLNLPPYLDMGSSAQEAYTNLLEKLPPKIRENLC